MMILKFTGLKPCSRPVLLRFHIVILSEAKDLLPHCNEKIVRFAQDDEWRRVPYNGQPHDGHP